MIARIWRGVAALRDSRQMVDLQDPAGSLQLVGELGNPIARVRTAGAQRA